MAVRPSKAYVLVSDRGHIWASSTRTLRREVIHFADNTGFGWSWEIAKKNGWRIIPVLITPTEGATHER